MIGGKPTVGTPAAGKLIADELFVVTGAVEPAPRSAPEPLNSDVEAGGSGRHRP
jgi:hypothetical protein